MSYDGRASAASASSSRNPFGFPKNALVSHCGALSEEPEETMAFTLKINGKTQSVDVDGDTPLLWVLRDVLGMTGTKFGCGMALCGACTVHIDGTATRSCITTVDSLAGSEV